MKEEIYREVNDNVYLRRNDADQGRGGKQGKRELESEMKLLEICFFFAERRNKIWIESFDPLFCSLINRFFRIFANYNSSREIRR